MKQQLSLFAPALSASAQHTIREALTLLEGQLREPGESFTSSHALRNWLRLQLSPEQREVFTALFLDNQNRLIAHEVLFRGTINSTQVHPREIVKAALQHNAAAVVVAHNHPSGYAEPSQDDRNITGRISEALALVDIRLLDHMVIGGMEIVSFAERGWL